MKGIIWISPTVKDGLDLVVENRLGFFPFCVEMQLWKFLRSTLKNLEKMRKKLDFIITGSEIIPHEIKEFEFSLSFSTCFHRQISTGPFFQDILFDCLTIVQKNYLSN